MAELHPPIVHFAIALTIVGVIFDFVGLILRKESLKNAGFWTFVIGVIAVWGAMFSGESAEELVEKFIEGTSVEEIFETHEELGKILPWIFLFLGLFRIYLFIKENQKIFILYIIVAFVSIGLIGYQGRLGGIMVYEYGVGVKPVMGKTSNNIHYEKDDD